MGAYKLRQPSRIMTPTACIYPAIFKTAPTVPEGPAPPSPRLPREAVVKALKSGAAVLVNIGRRTGRPAGRSRGRRRPERVAARRFQVLLVVTVRDSPKENSTEEAPICGA